MRNAWHGIRHLRVPPAGRSKRDLLSGDGANPRHIRDQDAVVVGDGERTFPADSMILYYYTVVPRKLRGQTDICSRMYANSRAFLYYRSSMHRQTDKRTSAVVCQRTIGPSCACAIGRCTDKPPSVVARQHTIGPVCPRVVLACSSMSPGRANKFGKKTTATLG